MDACRADWTARANQHKRHAGSQETLQSFPTHGTTLFKLPYLMGSRPIIYIFKSLTPSSRDAFIFLLFN